jgi:hypothetical protein
MPLASINRLANTLGAAVCCALLASSGASADGNQQQRGGPGGQRKPPQEAYTACQDESEGDACEVKLRDRTITGSCVADKQDGKLFCMPDQPPGPPPGAAEACQSKSEGDSCSMQGPDGNEGPAGTCEKGPDGQLGCRPSAPPR